MCVITCGGDFGKVDLRNATTSFWKWKSDKPVSNTWVYWKLLTVLG